MTAQALLPYAELVLCGLTSGFLAGMLGIGGGLVVVPALYATLPLLGVDAYSVPHVAAATSLAAMVPTTVSSAWAQYRRRAVDRVWVQRLVPGALLGACAGALSASHLPGRIITLLFVGYAALCAVRMGLSDGSGAMRLQGAGGAIDQLPAPATSGGAPFTAALAGAMSSLAGVGGAFIVVPYLVKQSLSMRTAVATSAVMSALLSVTGAAVFTLAPQLSHTEVKLHWVAGLVIGAIAVVSARHGVACSHRMPLIALRRSFALIALVAAIGTYVRL